MTDLIKITANDQLQPVVSGRDLYEFLEVREAYTEWFDRMIGYGFTEGTDFVGNIRESTGGRPAVDHALTLDMAKHLSMIQRTDRGMQARRYFIEVEKRAQKPLTSLDVLQATVANLVAQERRVAALEAQQEAMRTAMLAETANWRDDTTAMLNRAAKAAGGGEKYKELRNRSYELLEERAQCNLDIRLKNKRMRMLDQGVPRKAADVMNYLDVLENDVRLRQLYIDIVKELCVKYAA